MTRSAHHLCSCSCSSLSLCSASGWTRTLCPSQLLLSRSEPQVEPLCSALLPCLAPLPRAYADTCTVQYSTLSASSASPSIHRTQLLPLKSNEMNSSRMQRRLNYACTTHLLLLSKHLQISLLHYQHTLRPTSLPRSIGTGTRCLLSVLLSLRAHSSLTCDANHYSS